ncbi:MAG: hypothetical protein RXQ71_04650 [Caldisphaera sp.]
MRQLLMGYASLKHEYASTPTNKCNKIRFQADQLLRHEEREPISPVISAWGDNRVAPVKGV